MNVTVYGPLRSAVGEKTVAIEFDGGTVAEAIAAFAREYPRARPQLYDDGDLRASVRVAVDGESADFDDFCPAEVSLTLHPAVRGG